jgi:hypothetical protein
MTMSLALVVGVFIVAVGALGAAAPNTLMAFMESFIRATGALFVIAALRVAMGIVLVRAAAASRTPQALRVLGVIILVSGLITPLVGIARAHAILDWWSAQGAAFTRGWSVFALALGGFIVYAVVPQRRTGYHRASHH